MAESSLHADIEALPDYLDRAVLDEILSRLPPELQVELVRGFRQEMPAKGPGESRDFAIGFLVEGNTELTALFNRLIKRP